MPAGLHTAARSDTPAFDHRPGEFEATRGLASAPLRVVCHRTDDGWCVQLMRAGVTLHELDATAAIALGGDLVAQGTLLRDGFEPDGGASA